MKKALVIGVDYYSTLEPLRGCVTDAKAVADVLERHDGGGINFANPMLLIAEDQYNAVSTNDLREAIQELFQGKSEIALLYFAGHGHVEETGGYLCASDCKRGHEGIAIADIMVWAKESPATNKIIVLDSCHSGIAGDVPAKKGSADIGEGMTVLTASTAEQYSHEGANGAPGVFTDLFVDALRGGAANLVGDVTPGSIYAHIDQSLGPWRKQRPVFKTNVQTFISLRKAKPPIPLEQLRALATHFPTRGFIFPLDPTFEPERAEIGATIPPPDKVKNHIFAVLQNYVKVGLVRPEGAPHMWHAAMQSKSCKLTVLGEHYRDLVQNKLI